MKNEPTKQQKTFAMNVLRKASLRWYARGLAQKKAVVRKEGRKNVYVCAKCEQEIYRKDTKLDHIEPVVDPKKKGFTLDEFVARLLVEESGWQVLCKPCHDIKTKEETDERVNTRKSKKVRKKTSKAKSEGRSKSTKD